MAHTICTFNVNNLYVRYKFGQTFPGDMSEKSLVEDPQFGYLPIYKPELFDLFNPTQRGPCGYKRQARLPRCYLPARG